MRDAYDLTGKFTCIVCDDNGTVIDVYEGSMPWVWRMSQWCLRFYRRSDVGALKPVCIFRRADRPLAPL